MGVLHPTYTDFDLKDLSIQQRQELARAIYTLLLTDPDVKKLLRAKTEDLFRKLKPFEPES